jgi:hypothetical protein
LGAALRGPKYDITDSTTLSWYDDGDQLPLPL